jgi:pilus assembly protein Flp/PilA
MAGKAVCASRLTRGGQEVTPFLSREEGQGLLEYALIIVLVAIVVIAIMLLMSDVIEDWLSKISDFIGGLIFLIHSV